VCAAALAACALTVWYAQFRVRDAAASVRQEQARSQLDRSLAVAVAGAGGARRLIACGYPTADLGYQSTLGWDLHTSVGFVGFRPSRDVRRRRPTVLLATGKLARLGRHGRQLASTGPWRVIALRPRPACFRPQPPRT
jgi:hypothetical protein